MNNEVFRYRLQKLREEHRGLSRRTLSELCGLPPDAVRRYERGEHVNPRVEAVAALADYLQVSVDYLIGRTDNRKYF